MFKGQTEWEGIAEESFGADLKEARACYTWCVESDDTVDYTTILGIPLSPRSEKPVQRCILASVKG